MRDLLRAEALKARTGAVLPLLLLGGLLMSTITALGYASLGGPLVASGQSTPAAVTDDIVRAYMMTFLFAGLAGAVLVTREFGSGAMTRTVLEHRRGRVFWAKVSTGAAVGLGFGLVATGVAAIAPSVLLSSSSIPVTWTSQTAATAVGLVVCNIAAGVWGSVLGWLIRNQIAAVGAVLAITLLVDPGLQRLFAPVAKYLFTIALSSVYRDPKPDLLSFPVALVVIAVWLGVLGFIARRLFVARDVS